MRKHGWQLPYHPLQVVAIAVFLALGFAFYVFFLPFVGNKVFQYVVMALYTPLVACVLFLYIWCTATDPGDPGVFMSKKYVNVDRNARNTNHNKSKQVGSINEEDVVATKGNSLEDCIKSGSIGANSSNRPGKEKSGCCNVPFLANMLGWCLLPFSCRYHSHKQSSEQQKCEDGMFFCTLCEVEVLKYSKHCRVCDKCVDSFDHHCRWLNNCIGKRNYRRFVVLMVSALLMVSWFVHLGLALAAYSTVVYWSPCVDSMFPGAEAILCRDWCKVRKQLLVGAIYYCSGFLHCLSNACYSTTCSTFLLPCSSY